MTPITPTHTLISVLLLLSTSVMARPPEQHIHYSPDHQVALLELYTSEGCSSCPPADRWLSKLNSVLADGNKVVPLALHITYWDYIGWTDRYGHRRFDQRQRNIARRAHSRSIYTPQFVFNGRDFRGIGRFVSELETINARPAKLRLGLALEAGSNPQSPTAWVYTRPGKQQQDATSIYLAIYENALHSDVDAGENEGKTLKHDRVVRHLYGPVSQRLTDKGHAIPLHIAPGWNTGQMGIAVFAQDRTGNIVQAMALDYDKLTDQTSHDD